MFRIANARTPSSVVAATATQASITTLDAHANRIDRGDLATDDIRGRVGGLLILTRHRHTKFSRYNACVIPNPGQVLQGGKVEIVLPDLGDGVPSQADV